MIRSKNIIQSPLTLTHAYKYYQSTIDLSSKYNIPYSVYRNICQDANKELSRMIIEEGYFFKMPYRLGTIRIEKRKIDLNNLKPDFGLFNKTELKNKHLNEHSGNYYVRFYWNKKIATIVKNKSAYCFIPTRENKRTLAKLIKQNGMEQINKYFE